MITIVTPQGWRLAFCTAIIAVAVPGTQHHVGAVASCAQPEWGARPMNESDLEPPIPKQSPTRRRGNATRPRLAPSRRRLLGRLWQSAERQVAEVEARLMQGHERAGGLEQDAKTLAIVTRTVRDLLAIDEVAQSETRSAGAPPHDLAIRSRSEFRAELAQRLAGLLAERDGSPPSCDI